MIKAGVEPRTKRVIWKRLYCDILQLHFREEFHRQAISELLHGNVVIEVTESVIRRQFHFTEEEMDRPKHPEAMSLGDRHQCILVSSTSVRNWLLTFPPAAAFELDVMFSPQTPF